MGEITGHGHAFQTASRACNVRGIYLIQAPARSTSWPVVYLAEADSIEEANRIHRFVWNQGIVPFLVIRLPDCVRVYTGFTYEPETTTPSAYRGVLEAAIGFSQVTTQLSSLTSGSIDRGVVWETYSKDLSPDDRVDSRLLSNLRKLARHLQADGLSRDTSHALIGKFVYLRYLRDRDILSERKLTEWGFEARQVFGRGVQPQDMTRLIEQIDGWLNGSVFPLSLLGAEAPTIDQLQLVAGAFLGDEPAGQLHLDFRAYDFSYIPIETLSVIYEQFLADEQKDSDKGAFYTPIPAVDFMLSELDNHRPLNPGMRVLDPACGSGAFLVQCYRRLIERQMQSRGKLAPAELRDLLTRHIFGVERDSSACRVAELSLLLTMLDYIAPPDLHRHPDFKLPGLRGTNIFEADFFDAAWPTLMERAGFDWVVGNPPWLKATRADNPLALDWMDKRKATHPCQNLQLAQAFVWKALDHIAPGGSAALLLPAMTLFEKEDKTSFRKHFFARAEVWAIANLANLREVLFRGRARQPAAAIFFGPLPESRPNRTGAIEVFSPLVANQEANRSREPNKRARTWIITKNATELRAVSAPLAASGHSLPWKLAMWGTPRDARLLQSLQKRFPSLLKFMDEHGLVSAQGLEIRSQSKEQARDRPQPLDAVPELARQRRLILGKVQRKGRMYSFPPDATELIPKDEHFVRKGRGKIPLAACRPPHIIVDPERNYAVFREDFLAVPPIYIGIAGDTGQSRLLRALSLFLSSRFAAYHEFFTSSAQGVRGNRGTLADLRDIPTPLGTLGEPDLQTWEALHRDLVVASQARWRRDGALEGDDLTRWEGLEARLDELVFDALGLRASERWLIEDLTAVRRRMTDGALPPDLMAPASKTHLSQYAQALEKTLDGFVGPQEGFRHRARIIVQREINVVEVGFVGRSTDDPAPPTILDAPDATLSRVLEQLSERVQAQHGQWLYFDRTVFVTTKTCGYIFKPRHRFDWTRSQALIDADEFIASSLVGGA